MRRLLILLILTSAFVIRAATVFATEGVESAIEIQRDLFEHHRLGLRADIVLMPTNAAMANENDPGFANTDASIEDIRRRPIRQYFVEDFKDGINADIHPYSQRRLLQDLLKLHVHDLELNSKTDSDGQQSKPDFSKFEEKILRPMVESLSFPQLIRKPTFGGLPLADWSVGDLLKNLEFKHLKSQKGGLRRVLRYLDYRQYSRATIRNTAILSSIGAVTLYFQDPTTMAITAYLIFQEPLRDISGGLTGFMRRPLSQIIKLMEYRIVGNVEAYLNTFSNNMLQKYPPPKDNSMSVVMLPASIAVHGMDFAGASPSDQIENYRFLGPFYIEYQKWYSQLNTETYHYGRTLATQFMEEEGESAHYAAIALQRAEAASSRQEQILEFYANRNELSIEERLKVRDRMLNLMQQIRDAHEALWKDPYLPEDVVNALSAKIHRSEQTLATEYHVTYTDRKRLNREEKSRHDALALLVMGVALNDYRLFGHPEANRNLPPGPPLNAAAEMRKGYKLQNQVDDWQILVATILRRMGHKKNRTLDAHIAQSQGKVCHAFPGRAIAAE